MYAETHRFLAAAWEEGDLRWDRLMLSNETEIDATLAEIYGVPLTGAFVPDADITLDVRATDGLDGIYPSTVSFIDALVVDREVHECVSTQWFRSFLSRELVPADEPTMLSMTDALEGGEMRLSDLAVEMVLSEPFRRLR